MHLLVVEDDARVVRFLRRGLAAEGYHLEIATNGAQAIEMGESGRYDLIMLDVMLPDKSGIEVCRHLRDHGVHAPVLMLTAKDSLADKIEGLSSGADDYLTKPFAFEELVARTRALLRRPKDMEALGQLRVADLTLDRDAHEARKGGKLLELTGKEFDLLEYLMHYPGRVLSRTMIEEHVWGYGHDPLTNVVDVYIRRLRRKIADRKNGEIIRTIRGVGYKLMATATPPDS